MLAFMQAGNSLSERVAEIGLPARLRYRVHQLVSTVSCIRFVSRPICCAPVALLLGKVRN